MNGYIYAVARKSKVERDFLRLNAQRQYSVTSAYKNIHPLQHLQRAIGNRNVRRVLTSGAQRATRAGKNLKPSIRIRRKSVSPVANNVLQRAPYDSVRALNIAINEWSQTVREFPPCSNRGPEVDKYLEGRRGRRSVMHEGTRHRCGQPWCAYFVRWCLNRAGISHGITGRASSVRDWRRRWYHPISTGVSPERGDIFFIAPNGRSNHPCDNSAHPCVGSGSSGHAGFILGNWRSAVTTIEGNVDTGPDNDGISSKYRPISQLHGVLKIP